MPSTNADVERMREAREARKARGKRKVPFEWAWSKFLERKGWTPGDVRMIPDCDLYREWEMDQLSLEFED